MKVPVLDMTGKQVKSIDLPADIFEVEVNTGLMHQALVRQMAHARLGTAKVKRRGEVNRTSAKWYRQKGTGRARHGSRDATQFVGGGRPKGPTPHKYIKAMPRKMRQQAIRCALTALLRDEQLIFVDQLKLEAPKTKLLAKTLAQLGLKSSTLIVAGTGHGDLERAAANLPKVKVVQPETLNVYDVLRHDKLVILERDVPRVQEVWA